MAKLATKPVAKSKVQPKAKPVVKLATKAPTLAKKPAQKGPTAAELQRFTLHGFMNSGPTYTVGLMLNLCRHPFSYIHVSLREGQHKQPDYLVKNRYGQVPALRDGQTFYVQSAAILMHISEVLGKFEGKSAVENNRIREWLFWQWDKLSLPLFRLRGRARGFRQFGEEVRVLYETETKAALAVLDHELSKSEWIVGKKPTIADIGIYAVVRYAPEANIDLNPFAHVQAWKKRIEDLPGFGTPEQILPMESRLV
jgi:glutathione S-transferase